MTFWTPDVSEATMIGVGFLQGLSIGFLTIPINLITFATLPPEVRTEATGIYSLMRNLGSAIGISITGALLEINTQVNHALIAGDVSPVQSRLAGRGSRRGSGTPHPCMAPRCSTRRSPGRRGSLLMSTISNLCLSWRSSCSRCCC